MCPRQRQVKIYVHLYPVHMVWQSPRECSYPHPDMPPLQLGVWTCPHRLVMPPATEVSCRFCNQKQSGTRWQKDHGGLSHSPASSCRSCPGLATLASSGSLLPWWPKLPAHGQQVEEVCPSTWQPFLGYSWVLGCLSWPQYKVLVPGGLCSFPSLGDLCHLGCEERVSLRCGHRGSSCAPRPQGQGQQVVFLKAPSLT